MTTTTLRAAAARVHAAFALIDWQEVAAVVADGLRILWAAVQLITTALVLAAEIIYEHRAEIRAALVAVIAHGIVAVQLTIEAGRWTRRSVDALSSRSVALLPQQPLAPIAPITATLVAMREALERLVRQLYPAAA